MNAMMKMMMATLMTHNNPILNVTQNNQNSAAVQDHNSINIDWRIWKSVEMCDGDHDVIAKNQNTDKDNTNIGLKLFHSFPINMILYLMRSLWIKAFPTNLSYNNFVLIVTNNICMWAV